MHTKTQTLITYRSKPSEKEQFYAFILVAVIVTTPLSVVLGWTGNLVAGALLGYIVGCNATLWNVAPRLIATVHLLIAGVVLTKLAPSDWNIAAGVIVAPSVCLIFYRLGLRTI